MNLPSLDLEYSVSDADVAFYRENGHVLLRGVCSPEEIRTYRDAIYEATMRNNRETRPLEERDTYGKAFLQVSNLWASDEGVRKFVMSRRFGGIAAQLMGAEGVRLYHDQALFKEPGGGITPWHQDQFYWPLDTPTTVTMWMPLVDIDATMGSMSFANRSQEEGFVPLDFQISDQSEAFFDEYVRTKGYPLHGGGAMAAGDATFHSGWTLHRAPGNTTDRVREVMTVIYYPDGTRVAAPANDFQKADHRVCLDSIPVGELANGPQNPIVWP